MSKKVKIEVVKGAGGSALYIDDFRVCGPKPWGGGHVTHTWTATVSDLRMCADAATDTPTKETS